MSASLFATVMVVPEEAKVSGAVAAAKFQETDWAGQYFPPVKSPPAVPVKAPSLHSRVWEEAVPEVATTLKAVRLAATVSVTPVPRVSGAFVVKTISSP